MSTQKGHDPLVPSLVEQDPDLVQLREELS